MGDAITIGEASRRTGWSPRMLRYLEHEGLVVPSRTEAGYRRYGVLELNQLRTLTDLRQGFGVELGELAFAVRLRREPDLRAAVETGSPGQAPTATRSCLGRVGAAQARTTACGP